MIAKIDKEGSIFIYAKGFGWTIFDGKLEGPDSHFDNLLDLVDQLGKYAPDGRLLVGKEEGSEEYERILADLEALQEVHEEMIASLQPYKLPKEIRLKILDDLQNERDNVIASGYEPWF